MRRRAATALANGRRIAVALALAMAAAGPALAHDTWLRAEPAAPGLLLLALGTGDRWPAHESPVPRDAIERAACRGAVGAADAADPAGEVDKADAPAVRPLRPGRIAGASLQLSLARRAGAVGCWVQTRTEPVELPPPAVARYLDEIAAGPALREAWARQQAAGLAWRERFSKHARILLDGDTGAPASGVDLALDARVETPVPWRRGAPMVVQVLRDGQPLAGFALQWLHPSLPRGAWTVTDDQGRARFSPPLAGAWLLRGVDLRPDGNAPGTWESRFLSVALEVAEARADGGAPPR